MISFTSAAFLTAFAALLAPVLLHIMKREIARPLVFPTIRFLSKGRIPQEGKRRLRDLLLLLVRLLIFSIIILYFANPVFIEDSAEGSDRAMTRSIILLDNSASMAAGDIKSETVSKIEKLLSENSDQLFAFVSLPDEKEIDFTEDHNQIINAVKKQPVSYCNFPLQKAVKSVEDLAKGQKTTLYFYSDFQSSPWLENTSFQLPANVNLKLIDCQQPGLRNCALGNIEITKESAHHFQLDITVKNYSVSSEKTTLKVFNDETEVVRELSLPAGETVRSVIDFESKLSQAQITLSSDDLNADNTRYIYLKGKSPATILSLIAPKQSISRGEDFFLNKVITVNRMGRPKRFTLEHQPRQNLSKLDLKNYQAILLTALDLDIEQAQLEKLLVYVKGGGVLITTPRTGSGNLYLKLKKMGLVSATYSGQFSDSGTFSPAYVKSISSISDLNDVFNEESRPDLLSQPINRYIKLKCSPEKVLLKSTYDDPLLIEEKVGNGLHYIFTFSLDPVQSELPLSFSYLPLIRELLKPAAKEAARPVKIIECGELLQKKECLQPGLTKDGKELVEIVFPQNESQPDYLPLIEVRQRLVNAEQQKLSIQASDKKDGNQINLSNWLLLSLALLAVGYMALAGYYDRKETEATGTVEPNREYATIVNHKD